MAEVYIVCKGASFFKLCQCTPRLCTTTVVTQLVGKVDLLGFGLNMALSLAVELYPYPGWSLNNFTLSRECIVWLHSP